MQMLRVVAEYVFSSNNVPTHVINSSFNYSTRTTHVITAIKCFHFVIKFRIERCQVSTYQLLFNTSIEAFREELSSVCLISVQLKKSAIGKIGN